MSNLGNLWFTLGLDDTKFKEQWEKAMKQYVKDAKMTIDVELSAKTIASLKQLKDMGYSAKEWKAVREAAKAAGESAIYYEKVNAEKAKAQKHDIQDQMAAEKLNRLLNQQLQTQNKINTSNQKKITTANSAVAKEMQVQSLWLTNLHTMASNYLSIFAAKEFVTNLARISGEFEKQRVTLQAMVGEFEGSQLFSQIKELAVVSPFQFQDLTSYTKQLAAFSVPYNELYETTKSLADISAGLGVDMSRIILAYGQIRSAQVLKGTELRQLTEAGVPILEELAKKFTELEGRAVSVGEVFGKISQKLVPFSMVKDIFAEMTSEGGKFYNMQKIQAETLAGKISNLTDAYQIFLSKIGEQNEDALKNGIDWIYKLMDNYNLLASAIKTVVSATAAYQGVHAIGFAAEKIDKIKKSAVAMELLANGIKAAVVQMKKLDIATKANIWGIIISVITAIGIATWEWYKGTQRLNNELDKMLNADLSKLRDEQSALEKLKKATDEAAKGSQNRRDAINKINSRYGEYLDNMLTEASTANEVAAAYDRITEAMQNKYKQESLEKAKAKVEDEYGGKINSTISSVKADLISAGLTGQEAKDVIANLIDAYKNGVRKAVDIQNIIKKRIGDELYKQTNLGVTGHFEELKVKLREQVVEYQKAMEDAEDRVNLRFSPGTYSTKAEADFVEQLTEKYKKLEEAIRSEEGTTTEQVRKRLENLEKQKLQELSEAYANPEFLNNPALAKKYEQQWLGLEKVVADWAKKVNEIVGNNTALFEFNPQENQQLLDYLKVINERYNEIIDAQKKLKNEDGTIVVGGQVDYDLYEQKLKGLKEIANAINFTLTKDNAKATASMFQNYENKLNKFFDDIALKSAEARRELNAISFDGLNDDEITAKIRQINDEFDKGTLKIEEYKTKFIQQWIAIQQAQAKAKGKVFDGTVTVEDLPEEARTLLNLLDQIIVKRKEYNKLMLEDSIVDRYASLDKQRSEISAKFWKEFELGFGKEGFDFTQWNEAFKKALYKLDKELDPIYKEIFSNVNYATGDSILEAIKMATEKLKKDNLTEEDKQEVLERIKELQNAYRELGEIDITTNITDLIKRVQRLSDLRKRLDAATPGSDNQKALQMQYDAESENIKLSKGAVAATAFADGLASAANAMRELAQATGDAELEEMAESLNNIGNTLSSFINGFLSSGSWIGAVIGGVTSIVNNTINGIVKAKVYNEQLIKSTEDYQKELVKLKLTLSEGDYDTIFGVNSLNKVNDATKKAKESLDEYYNYVNKKFAGSGGGITKLDNKFKAERDALNRDLTELESILVKTKDRSGFANFFGFSDEYKTLKDYAPTLWNEDGSFNVENAEDFLKTTTAIDDKQKDQIQHAIELHKIFEENLEVVKEYLDEVFSDTATTIADRMIDAFARTGDAAADLGDIVNEIAKGMASDLIEALLLDTYLKPAMDKIKGMYDMTSPDTYIEDSVTRTQDAILAMKEGLAAAQAAVPEVNKILSALEATGIDLSSDTESASDVLSGLTEDEQHLLVSYINGIRADVSINKGLLTSLVNYAGTINNNIALALVVWKQIEANTSRSADGIDKLIEHFESITGAYDGGGGQAIRVNIA